MDPREIVIRPLVTEKGTRTASQPNLRAYPFEVHLAANKVMIRRAIEEIYKVRVLDVRTATVHGKVRRTGRTSGVTRRRKKAVVKLHPDDHIDLF